jgi:lipoprotein
MKRDLFVLLLCICTLGFVACSHKGNGKKVTYRFAPKMGQPMEYTTTSVTETDFFGQPFTFTNKVKTKQTPISKENGIFTLMSQIEDLSTTVSVPKANAAIQENAQSTKAKITGMQIFTKVDEQGNVVAEPHYEGISAEEAKILTQDNLGIEMVYRMKFFPEHAITVGDTWENKMQTNRARANTKYKLEQLDDTSMTVSFTGTVQSTIKENKKWILQVEGKRQFDRSTGVPIPGTSKVKMTGGSDQEGGKITITSTT